MTTKELLFGDVATELDRNRAGLEAAMDAASEEDLEETWTMRKGEHVIISGPRAVVLRQAGHSETPAAAS
jgi:hypothetical protein